METTAADDYYRRRTRRRRRKYRWRNFVDNHYVSSPSANCQSTVAVLLSPEFSGPLCVNIELFLFFEQSNLIFTNY